jgi:nitrogen fixation/metabolism regulation signal transduction histidine kinase
MTIQRRRLLLIDRRFQFTLIGTLLAVQLVLLGGAVGVLWLFLDSEMGATLASAHATAVSVRALLGPVLATVASVNALVAIGATVAVVLVASHRIAGPLYRVQAALASVEQGDLVPFTAIREHDQTGPLAAQLTATVRQLANDVAMAQQGLDAAAAACAASGQPVPPAVHSAREQLQRYRVNRGSAPEGA